LFVKLIENELYSDSIGQEEREEGNFSEEDKKSLTCNEDKIPDHL
jgi:hypothetical protein